MTQYINLNDVVDILAEYSDYNKNRGLNIADKRKPTHGSCCTCQECGYDHDDCVCLHNEIVTMLKLKIKG